MEWYKWLIFILITPVALFLAGIWVVQTISIYILMYKSIFTNDVVILDQGDVSKMILYAIWTIQMVSLRNK